MLLETAVYDQDNEYVGGKSIPVTQNTYDPHGALIEVKNMDKDRDIINHPETGVAITEYKYDELGNRIETLRYDKDRAPVKYLISSLKYIKYEEIILSGTSFFKCCININNRMFRK